MNSKTLKIMEYDRIKQALRGYLVSAAGQHELAKLAPTADAKQLQIWLDETRDGADIYRLESGIPLPKLDDIRPHLHRLAMEAALNGLELAQISRVLWTTGSVAKFFRDLAEKEVALRRLDREVKELVTLPDVTRRLRVSLEGDGRLTDEASPALKQIRQHITQTEAAIRTAMDQYTRGKDAKYLSETIVTIRDERYVIPVRAEYKQHFGGIVHDQSASGQTLFIEPQAVVGLNNRLRQNQIDERHEEQRILAELTALLEPYQDEILRNSEILGHFDFINAKAKYAHALKATEPQLSVANQVSLRQARHPLIDQKKVVANDIAIGKDYKAIIVTGPNTGGKTITLKTLALVQLMGQSGLFIPANENSVIGVFHDIFADIGDEQSIEQSLSTFSGHMENIVAILKQADEHSLIVVDELGAGTDPQEGAALAIAILDEIGTLGSYVMASTHYPELKAYGYNRPDTINASMEFNGETLQPTYHLLIGIPGRSNALDIAARLGMPAQVVDAARGLTDQDSQDLNAMISDLTEQKRRVDQDAESLRTQLAEANEVHDQLQKQFDAYQHQKDQLMLDAKRDANRLVDESRKRANQIISDLRKKQLAAGKSVVKEDELIAAQGALNALQQDTKLKKNRVLRREKAKLDFHKGDSVLVKSYGQIGVLMQQLDDSHWEVQLGILKMKIANNDLEKTKDPAKSAKQPRASVKRSGSSGMSPTLDLRGHRYEEAMAEVDRYIDSALLAGYPSVTIIHGKGTGALRKGVTEYLKRNNRIKSFGFSPANAGGDGSTVVRFK
ncbi:MAG: endonuclease MutS2 [Levilactobacillus sp.]|jgi:DNA mismatch repair protein MutS2|uniref:Endonuclease MutS2 n=1 Tax=Levilactobacillus suantsaiihabitans TaxID=2487722 RepID=A0A4Z0JDB3_9LACO|nr:MULTISPECIES: endonuclease MutS2 [Levilactobacillus]MCH4124267.1 endonuclease MutS2 [Levilactobacillus sp.]MCI1554604.1 endonuclease MutS2 [Levilactobacillus sp.]MCI1599412.1 endonuclease MutS2 [Levilactobacillus sp.]MCI1606408.1 endonuclease MutS2 [Levilactobacillus sp.]TGD19277.1 endonuclease MutS2 [Levilactobacillus suantsaiihabitans]